MVIPASGVSSYGMGGCALCSVHIYLPPGPPQLAAMHQYTADSCILITIRSCGNRNGRFWKGMLQLSIVFFTLFPIYGTASVQLQMQHRFDSNSGRTADH